MVTKFKDGLNVLVDHLNPHRWMTTEEINRILERLLKMNSKIVSAKTVTELIMVEAVSRAYCGEKSECKNLEIT